MIKKIISLSVFMLAFAPAYGLQNDGAALTLGTPGTPYDLAEDLINASNSGTTPGGTITVTASEMSVNDMENELGAGLFRVNLSGGNLTVNGNLENNSEMHIVGPVGNINITGNLVNGNNAGSLELDGAGLSVGGDFVNKGDFDATIAGATNFANGFDIFSMTSANTFLLRTETLTGPMALLSNNAGLFRIDVTTGGLTAGEVLNGTTNSAAVMDLTAQSVNLTSVENVGGTVSIKAEAGGDIDITGTVLGDAGTDTTIAADGDLTVGGAVSNAGDMVLNGQTLSAQTLVNSGSGSLDVLGHTDAAGALDVAGDVTNTGAGDLTIWARDVQVTGVLKNSGTGTLTVRGSDTAGDSMQVGSLNADKGLINIDALYGSVTSDGAITATGGSVNFGQNTATVKADSVNIGGNLTSGTAPVTGAGNMNFANVGPVPTILDSANNQIGGNVSGSVGFKNLEQMNIGGSWTFDDRTSLNAVIQGRGTGSNWGAVTSTANGFEIGGAGEPLISVNGGFISDINTAMTEQVTLSILDDVAPTVGDAIWLVHADGGVTETGDKNMRDVIVKFCNQSGTLCADYAELAYISVRDDNLWIVFDQDATMPGFFKIQPVVDAEPGRRDGEYYAAGALDELIDGALTSAGFNNGKTLEMVPLVFNDTIFDEMSNELYDRMTQYTRDGDGTGLQKFSHLFAPREIDQIKGMIALNEHTLFRDFEDRMIDEALWDRYRWMAKAWLELDYGVTTQTDSMDVDVKGTRVNALGGVDWQTSETFIWGLTGHITHTSADSVDRFDIGYKANKRIDGFTDLTVTDTNIGIGAYMMEILAQELRLYGNAFMDYHMLDVAREQTYMDKITGDGSSFAITTEWGLLHDWLNEYLIGNLYARAGYNFGWDVSETVGGSDYMSLESDGYFYLTPGYSLTLTKRIYPTAFFAIRPYLSAGVEYDLIGTPDMTQFKFAPAQKYTDYQYKIDPLWAFAGGGVELLGDSGVHVGLDYRYQYNDTIQMHHFKISGMYRF